jgi:hypothetical protein
MDQIVRPRSRPPPDEVFLICTFPPARPAATHHSPAQRVPARAPSSHPLPPMSKTRVEGARRVSRWCTAPARSSPVEHSLRSEMKPAPQLAASERVLSDSSHPAGRPPDRHQPGCCRIVTGSVTVSRPHLSTPPSVAGPSACSRANRAAAFTDRSTDIRRVRAV